MYHLSVLVAKMIARCALAKSETLVTQLKTALPKHDKCLEIARCLENCSSLLKVIVGYCSDGWVEVCSVPIVALSLQYTYHPVPPLDFAYPLDFDVTTPEKEEMLLSPMRPPKGRAALVPPDDFDPGSMVPDVLSLELEIGPSVGPLSIPCYGNPSFHWLVPPLPPRHPGMPVEISITLCSFCLPP